MLVSVFCYKCRNVASLLSSFLICFCMLSRWSLNAGSNVRRLFIYWILCNKVERKEYNSMLLFPTIVLSLVSKEVWGQKNGGIPKHQGSIIAQTFMDTPLQFPLALWKGNPICFPVQEENGQIREVIEEELLRFSLFFVYFISYILPCSSKSQKYGLSSAVP